MPDQGPRHFPTAIETAGMDLSQAIVIPEGDSVPRSLAEIAADATGVLSNYLGPWNASTNTPALPAATTIFAGRYYEVSVAGSTTIDGISSWAVGDLVKSTGLVWVKILAPTVFIPLFATLADVESAVTASYPSVILIGGYSWIKAVSEPGNPLKVRMNVAGGGSWYEPNEPQIDPAMWEVPQTGNAAVKLQQCLNTAADLGVPFNAYGRLYEVSGSLALTSTHDDLQVQRIRLKQLAPAGTAGQRTISLVGVTGARLEQVQVDRNGNGQGGSFVAPVAAGIYFSGCQHLTIEDCEVFGNDKGYGIWGADSSYLSFRRPHVHDIRYDHAFTAVTDDTVSAITLSHCNHVEMFKPHLHGAGRLDQATIERDRWSRMLVFGGVIDAIITEPRVSRCAQGIDFSGSYANRDVQIRGGYLHDIFGVGIALKLAAQNVRVYDVLATNVGRLPFGAYGAVNTGDPQEGTRDNGFYGCVARNTGSQGWYISQALYTAGFTCEQVGGAIDQPGSPRRIRFQDCEAYTDKGSSVVTFGADGEVLFGTYDAYHEGQPVLLTTSGTLPAAFALATEYWLSHGPIVAGRTHKFYLATTFNNAIDGVVISSVTGGSGTHTLTLVSKQTYGFFRKADDADTISEDAFYLENCHASGSLSQEFRGFQVPATILSGAAQAIPTGGSGTTVLFATQTDLANITDTSGITTIPREGFWMMNAGGYFAANATGQRGLGIKISTDGGSVWNFEGSVLPTRDANAAGTTHVRETLIRYCAAGEMIRFDAYQTSGGNLNFTPTTPGAQIVLMNDVKSRFAAP